MNQVHDPGADELVGRARDLESLARLLLRHRLVTLVGPPGIGKTSVATAIAASARPAALFCDLVRVSTRLSLLERLAHALALGRVTGVRVGLDAVIARLADRGEPLIVLDNAEHVLPHVRWIAEALLAGTRARLLVTSREALQLRQECRRELAPLNRRDTLALLLQRLEKAGVEPPPDDPALGELATRLDGVPLAVEIVAAQAQGLPLARVLADLERVGTHARSPFRDVDNRHGSMRSALSSSWHRLRPAERRALRDLTVFRRPFERADAEGLLGPGPVLDALAARSLVVVDPERRRFRLLEPIRDFVRAVAGRPPAAVERGAAERLGQKASRLTEALHGRRCLEAVAVLEDQLFDLVAAAEWMARAGRHRESVELACALEEYLAWRGPFSLGLRLLSLDDRTLAALPAALRARVHACRGRAHVLLGSRPQARRELEAAKRARGAGTARTRALAELWEALDAYWFFDGARAAEGFARAAAAADAARAPFEAAAARLYLGCTLAERGRPAEARRTFGEAADLIEEHGIVALGPRLEVYRLHFAGGAVPEEQRARRLARALSLTEALHDLRFSAAVLTALADLCVATGDLDRAVTHYELAARRYEDVGFVTAVPLVRLSLALAHWLAGRTDAARRILQELAGAPDAPVANAWYARAALAGLMAESGQLDPARRALRECEPAARGDPAFARVLALYAGLLSAIETGRPALARRTLQQHRAGALDTPGSNSEVVLSLRVVEARLARLASAPAAGPALILGPDAAWFRLGSSGEVALGRRRALRGVLCALAAGAPERWSSLDELFAAGWPGERAAPRSAGYRVYSAVRTLRTLGLSGVLQTGPQGYRLTSIVERAPSEGRPVDRQDEA